jgi:hypothetical protein
MKKLLIVISMFMALSQTMNAQINYEKETENANILLALPGFIYVYEVDFYGDVYDFIVTLKKFDDSGIEFDYEMTNASNTKGTVKISKEAMQNAIGQNNYFSGGLMDLTNLTTVWLSRKVINDLIETGKAIISTDGGKTQTTLENTVAGQDFAFYNKISDMEMTLPFVYAESKDGSAKYWITLNKSNPMILKMDLGWSITFKEMRK